MGLLRLLATLYVNLCLNVLRLFLQFALSNDSSIHRRRYICMGAEEEDLEDDLKHRLRLENVRLKMMMHVVHIYCN